MVDEEEYRRIAKEEIRKAEEEKKKQEFREKHGSDIVAVKSSD